MAPSYCIDLTADEKAQLLSIARTSIEHGLAVSRPLKVDHTRLPSALTESYGNFITLTQRGTLRGCIGTIQEAGPLAVSVARNAFAAAFHDHRFDPLFAEEIDRIRIEISILSRPEPFAVSNREELLDRLQPGEDGLILNFEDRYATFLPKVWEKIPDKESFVRQLMLKASLPGNFWSESIRFQKYKTINFAEQSEASATLI